VAGSWERELASSGKRDKNDDLSGGRVGGRHGSG